MNAAASKGLGRGISALLDEEEYEENDAANDEPHIVGQSNMLPHDALQPGRFQPRKYFAEEELEELAESIRRNGVIQPLVVRALEDGSYEIVAGERRWRAAKMANLSEVPVVIKELDDRQTLEIALIENVQRQDLNPLEESEGYQRLMDEFGYTQEELATVVGKSRSHVTNMMRLLGLPEDVKSYINDRKLSMSHARALIGAENPAELARTVIDRGLSVRQTENLAKNRNMNAVTASKAKKESASGKGSRTLRHAKKDDDILSLEQALSQNIGLNVEIFDRGQKGDIVISYESLEDLDDVLRRLGGVV